MRKQHPLARIALLTFVFLLVCIQFVSAATGSINATDVRFRSVPSTASADTILSLLSKGTAVEILGLENSWYQVKADGVSGYVYAQYVTPDPEPAAPVVSTAPAATTEAVVPAATLVTEPVPAQASTPAAIVAEPMVFVEANTLNVRASATAESALLGQITFGMEVVWLEAAGEWAKIRTADGIAGYVLARYLVPLDTTVSRGSSELTDELIATAMSLLGVRYVYGGMSESGFDCSGFVKYVYQAIGVNTPRSSYEYGAVGLRIPRTELAPGDVLLWDTDGSGVTNISHVGIYLGNDKYIHASTTLRGVVVTSVSEYRATYLGARRFLR